MTLWRRAAALGSACALAIVGLPLALPASAATPPVSLWLKASTGTLASAAPEIVTDGPCPVLSGISASTLRVSLSGGTGTGAITTVGGKNYVGTQVISALSTTNPDAINGGYVILAEAGSWNDWYTHYALLGTGPMVGRYVVTATCQYVGGATHVFAGSMTVAANGDYTSLTPGSQPPPVVNVTAPSITGTPMVADTLTAQPGTWTPADATFAYQWNLDGSPITGATNATYVPLLSEVGHSISVTVTASALDNTDTTLTSVSVEVAPIPSGLPFGWLKAPTGTLGSTAPEFITDGQCPVLNGVTASNIRVIVTGGSGKGAIPGTVGKNYTGTLLISTLTLGSTDAINNGYVIPASAGSWNDWFSNYAGLTGPMLGLYAVSAKCLYAGGASFDFASAMTVDANGNYTSLTPGAMPGAVANLTAPTVTGTATYPTSLTADPGTWNPAAPAFTYQWLRDGVDVNGATTPTLTPAITDVGHEFSFRVTAHQGGFVDTTLTSASVLYNPAVPDSPTNVVGVHGNGDVAVSWAAPASDNGAAITKYSVTAAPGGATCSTTIGLSCTVGGLTNGTAYTFTVVATNSAGDSLPSAPSAPVTPYTTPNAPTTVVGTPGDSHVSLTWAAPTSDGGSAITAYSVAVTPAAGSCDVTGTTADCTGLTNGTAYTFTVTATNAAGDSSASAPSAQVTPATVPSVPTNVAAVVGNATAHVSWSAPTSTGGWPISGYAVTASPGGAHCYTLVGVSVDPLSCDVVGLTNGTAYTFKVVAVSQAGASAASAASTAVTPFTVATAPVGLSARSGNGQVSLTWSVPASDGGAAVSGYSVSVTPNAGSCLVTGTTAVCSGLANGTSYSFSVTATNTAGSSSAASVSSTPRTVPGKVAFTTPTIAKTAITVRWRAAAANGAPVTRYTVVIKKVGGGYSRTVTTAGLSQALSGLKSKTKYTISVTATNAAGTGGAVSTTVTTK